MIGAQVRAALNDEGAQLTRGNDVYEKLRLAIVTGEIRPNEPLIEADLASALEVSRTPIRESLQRLAADGLIVPRKRGWAVREYTPEETRENYEVRAALEGYAARLAAQRATDEELANIKSIHDRRASQKNPPHDFRIRSNREFHDAIIAAARNKKLAHDVFRAGQFYLNRRVAGLTDEQELEAANADHDLIVQALMRRDEAGAEEAMRAHIMRAFDVFRRVGGF